MVFSTRNVGLNGKNMGTFAWENLLQMELCMGQLWEHLQGKIHQIYEGLNLKMTELNGGFSTAMFEYLRVTPATGEISWRSMFHKMHRNNTKDTKGRRMD